VSIRTAEEKATRAGELEGLLGGLLDLADELVKPYCDSPCRMMVRETNIGGEQESLRGVLALLFNDLVHTWLGRRLRL
jgi:hypothetical protein